MIVPLALSIFDVPSIGFAPRALPGLTLTASSLWESNDNRISAPLTPQFAGTTSILTLIWLPALAFWDFGLMNTEPGVPLTNSGAGRGNCVGVGLALWLLLLQDGTNK